MLPSDPPAPPIADYHARFGGLGRLFGAGALSRLQAAHVCVVGVGGVGSWTVEGLARSGVGALTLIDLDDVCVTNVNRQLPALDGTIGRPKIDVLSERARAINPACRIKAVPAFLTPANAASILVDPFDFVVDAVDRGSHKAGIIGACRARGIRVLTVGSAGGRRDPGQIRAGDLGDASGDELLRLLRKRLRRDYGFAHGEQRGRMDFGVRCVWSEEPPVFPWADGSCSLQREPGSDLKLDCASGFGTAVFVTGVFGLAAAGEVVRCLVSEAAAGASG